MEVYLHLQALTMEHFPYSEHILIDGIHSEEIIHICSKDIECQGLYDINRVIGYIKDKPEFFGKMEDFFIPYFSCSNIYFFHNGLLYGFYENIELNELSEILDSREINLYFLYEPGGATGELCGYRFVIHSNEEIHRNIPHVHVKHDDYSVRYYLQPEICRFRNDRASREYDRDEKKIIIPYIRDNMDVLMERWNLCVRGIKPPEVDINGNQVAISMLN